MCSPHLTGFFAGTVFGLYEAWRTGRGADHCWRRVDVCGIVGAGCWPDPRVAAPRIS